MKTKDFYSSLKKGDILYESCHGYTVEIRLLDDAVLTSDEDGWRVTFPAESSSGKIDYLITQIGLNYGCGRLSREPEYVGKISRLDGTEDTI